jgi:hypothetical protein
MAPVDPAGLAVIRFGLGSLIAWEVWREFDLGFLRADYANPAYLFRWSLFEWVKPLPGTWFYLPFVLLFASAVCVALGLFYRPAAIVQWAGVSYWFLLEKTRYLNHRYLACLFALLLIFIPAHATYSLDARRKPWVRSGNVPAWTLWLMRFQVGVPYFFAGVAKLNFDWLVRAEPLHSWLADQTSFPVVGRYLATSVVAHLFAYGAAALDLSVSFLLLHRRTRAPAFGLALAFHFLNSRFFNIGMFPWMMIVATTVFFDPDWPRRYSATLRSGRSAARGLLVGGFVLGFLIGGFLPTTFSGVKAVVGGFGMTMLAFLLLPESSRETGLPAKKPTGAWRAFVLRRTMTWALAAWVAIQALVPLRHFAIPGNAQWTEEGSRFAWHMLLHQKSGRVTFRIRSASALPQLDLGRLLTRFQMAKMAQYPDMILQFTHHLEERYRALGATSDIAIRVRSTASLNGRRWQTMIDPRLDLTMVRRPYLPPARWIVPLRPFR